MLQSAILGGKLDSAECMRVIETALRNGLTGPDLSYVLQSAIQSGKLGKADWLGIIETVLDKGLEKESQLSVVRQSLIKSRQLNETTWQELLAQASEGLTTSV